MGTSPKFVYYTKECRDKGPLSCCTKKEPGVRNFDARRVSRSILHEILGEMHKEVPKHSCKQKKSEPKMEPIPLNKPSSMSDLIIWNVSKALQTRPCLDLKSSIKAAEKRLSTEPGDLTAVSDQHPEQQYLLCALLAWHQLGHHSADSLYKFVKPKMKERSGDGKCDGKCDSKPASKDPVCSNEVNNSKNASPNPVAWKNVKPSDDGSFGVHTSGPVLTLPMEPKFILRVDNTGACNKPLNSDKPGTAGTTGKLDAACCLDKQCVETLAELDKKTNELRARAFQLMQHEGTRAQLLGRAEEAWTDLEKNYQKQLTAEKEKGKDMEKQVKNMVTERNVTKVGVKAMAEDLTKKKEGADLAKQKLTDLEKLVIDLAATKLRLSEEAAKGEAAVAEELARVLQYERDLMFNEDQARRKLNSLMNESDSARALTCETERALRAELAALRDQIENVSKQLQTEEDESSKTKAEQDQLRQEKKDLIEDLENCKSTCDKKMQWLLDDLRDRKKKLLDLQDQVLECRCKVPTDASVQVKRTASLVALCHCAPEDHLLESCSCTSMRSRLLTNLLTDLFSGLQSELGNAGGLMPCHMLKCLEDQHVWDKPSQIKTNIRNFFSKLLKNELNIAIATSIEFYHATWVGTSCADAEKMEPTPEDDLKEGWQKRAIERRAQQLANKLVKDLYHDKFEHIKQPCDCQSPTGKRSKMSKPPDAEKQIPKSRSQTDQTELYPCLVSPYTPFNRAATTVYQQAIETLPPYWKKTIQDVTQLKLQIEDLKKDSIKKEDLKVMEENISKIVREASVIENEDSLAITRDTSNSNGEKKEIKNSRVVKREESPKTSNQNKSRTVRRKDSKGGLSNSGSWNRAYGLLQEYLKIKIKRVQCLCVMNDRKDVILPEVLDKVCNLIESDFKRLKDICTCENNTGTRTNIMRIGDIVLPPPTELPEKDTNTSQAKYNDRKMKMCSVVSKLSKQNSNNSIIIKENISAQVSPIIQENISAQVSPIIKENISAQVPPYLGMEAKSCDIMEPPINKNARTTETDQIITESKSNGIMYNTCDCCDNTDKVDILKFPDMFGTKEVLVNLYTEQAINTGDIYDHSLVSIDQVTSGCLLAGEVETTKSLTKTENSKSNEKSLVTQKRMAEILPPIAPYIGYTVDCSCDDALGSCFCIKSVVQSNNDKIDSLWKGSLLNDNKQYSYIMHGNPNQNNSDVDVNCYSIRNDSVIDQTSTTAVINDDLFTCEAEILAENVDDLVLKFSLDNVGLTNQAANTVDVESSSLETAYSNSDFFAIDWIKSPLPAVSGRSHAVKLTKSIYYPGIPIDNDQNSFTSGTTTDFDTQKTSESCVCDKVPICHVKMLVEHIEKNLVESKCTCDSLISKVCPVHSKRDF
ncbi:hypothetical protein PYW08_014029 [Mythimna loreyi]|uniref:Uncharacterized protein n=1 Tax=Mythimna loreyi TaxID=667449 RepID=A0ACC2R783_9NEOP|nr:hypothetical protein PYW08_014029 [Mythimna loreyi]